jgi:hypothetical protein
MIEQDIERVLEGLGRIEAPQGFEDRVLRAIESHKPVARGFALAWVGVAALLVAGSTLGGLKYIESANASAVAAEEQRMANEGALDPILPPYQASPAAVSQTHASHGYISPAFRMNLATGVTPLPDNPRPGAPSIASLPHAMGGSTAKVEPPPSAVAEEAGFPAPPAPLTDQERLLLKLARRPNEATIAMFDQGIREERAAAEKAEFDFLNPQRPVETEPPTDSKPPTDSTLTEEKSNDRSQSNR